MLVREKGISSGGHSARMLAPLLGKLAYARQSLVTASREGKKLLKEQANDLSRPSTLLPENVRLCAWMQVRVIRKSIFFREDRLENPKRWDIL